MTQDLGQCPTNTVVSMGRRNTRPKPPCRASIAKSRSRTLIQNGTPSWPGPDCVRANTAVLQAEVLTDQAQRGEHAEQEQKDAAAGVSNRYPLPRPGVIEAVLLGGRKPLLTAPASERRGQTQ